MLFALFWLIAYITYTSQFVVQVSAASYYFNSNGSHEGDAEVMKGFKFAYLNHIGSLAMGSFIIAIIWLLKVIFIYAARAASKV